MACVYAIAISTAYGQTVVYTKAFNDKRRLVDTSSNTPSVIINSKVYPRSVKFENLQMTASQKGFAFVKTLAAGQSTDSDLRTDIPNVIVTSDGLIVLMKDAQLNAWVVKLLRQLQLNTDVQVIFVN